MGIAIDNPYVGPRPFGKEDSSVFFGREREGNNLLSLVLSNQLVLFYAPSGAGKSSLINAFLIPYLEKEDFKILPIGRVGGELIQGVGEVYNVFVFNLLLNLTKGEENTEAKKLVDSALTDFLRTYNSTDATGNPNKEQARVLIIDQFEEIFTTHLDHWQERENFFQQLRQSIADDPFLWVILAMREDYVPTLDRYAWLLPNKLQVRFHMQRMSHAAGRRAIENPAEMRGRRFDPEATEKLIENLTKIRVSGETEPQTGQFIEPMHLQVVCYQLWENLINRSEDHLADEITVQDLEEFGDVDEALAQFYEDTIANTIKEYPDQSEIELRNWFEKQLITDAGTRGMVFQGKEHTGGLSNKIADFLDEEFILRAEARTGGTWYELVHDRLVEPILEANRAWRLRQDTLVQAALAWQESGKSEDELYPDPKLKAALADTKGKIVESLVKEFLDASQEFNRQLKQREKERQLALEAAETAAREAEARRKAEEERAIEAEKLQRVEAKRAEERAKWAKRLGWLSAFLLFVILLAVAAAAYAAYQAEQTRVERSRRVDDWVQEYLIDNRLDTALLFSIEAINIEDHSIARKVLQETLDHFPQLTTYLRAPRPYDQIRAASFEGPKLALANKNGALGLWTADGPPLVLPLTSTVALTNIVFSPGVHTLAQLSADNSIKLWNLDDNRPFEKPLEGHAAAISKLAFQSDDQILVSGDVDGTIILWNFQNQDQPLGSTLANLETAVTSLAISPDGRILASGDAAGNITLWDLQTQPVPTRISTLTRLHNAVVNNLAFSPNHQTLASGDSDGTIILWDLWNQNQPLGSTLTDLGSAVTSLAISPDGRILASASDGEPIMLWHLSDDKRGQSLGPPLAGHIAAVTSILFSPDGQELLSIDEEGPALLWDLNLEARRRFQLLNRVPADFFFSLNKDESTTKHPHDIRQLTLKEWRRLACHIANRNLTWDEWQRLPKEPSELTCPELPIHPSFIEAGRALARKGDVEGAIAFFENILALDRKLNLDPETEAKRLAVPTLVEQGRAQVRGGDVDGALDLFNQALELIQDLQALDPNLDLDFDPALALVEEGRALASGGNVEGAKTLFVEAKDLNPNLDFDPEAAAEALKFIEDGRTLARGGDADGAVALFEQAQKRDPNMLDFDPETEARRLAVPALVEQGSVLARAGSVEEAIALFDRAKELNPDLNLDPEARVKELAALALTEQGTALARTGDAEGAIALFEQALDLNPNLNLEIAQVSFEEATALATEGNVEGAIALFNKAQELNPDLGFDSVAAAGALKLVEQGRDLVSAGEVDEAIAAFKQARELDQDLELDPEAEVAQGLFERALNLAEQGQVEDAKLAYLEAKKWDPSLGDSAGYFASQLCRFGSLGGNPNEDILKACDEAVESAPGWSHNDRGIVLTLIGEFELAQEDFRFFIDWSKENGLYETYGQRREEWLSKLEAGQSPFDQATLEELRNQNQ
jgi:WD40 repeat protein/tetratricopeptide (TPR) repeat protein